MKIIKLALIIGFMSGVAVAAASEQMVSQKGRHFSISEATVKKGDTLVFVNDDNISHNVLSTTPGNEFNLKSQAPGTSIPVTFDTVGDIKIICAIHPAMQMTVKVTE
jgi:plastocyanin